MTGVKGSAKPEGFVSSLLLVWLRDSLDTSEFEHKEQNASQSRRSNCRAEAAVLFQWSKCATIWKNSPIKDVVRLGRVFSREISYA